MALILMEDDNQLHSAFIIGLYELQKELSHITPSKIFHIDLDYLAKFPNIISYISSDNENLQAIQLIKNQDTSWKKIAQDCFEILISTLKDFNIEIRKSDEAKVTYGEQYNKLNQLITDMIRPALASHAGNIEIAYFTKHIIGLKLLGSCQGCPFSMQTLTLHIAKILGLSFPEFLIIHVTHIIDWNPEMQDKLIK